MDADKTTEFIGNVQALPILWKKDNQDFFNRDKKRKAFQQLAEISGISAALNLAFAERNDLSKCSDEYLSAGRGENFCRLFKKHMRCRIRVRFGPTRPVGQKFEEMEHVVIRDIEEWRHFDCDISMYQLFDDVWGPSTDSSWTTRKTTSRTTTESGAAMHLTTSWLGILCLLTAVRSVILD